jgi:hypothetical protein
MASAAETASAAACRFAYSPMNTWPSERGALAPALDDAADLPGAVVDREVLNLSAADVPVNSLR